MKLLYGALPVVMLAAAPALAQAPTTSPDTPTYVVTYLEVLPAAKGVTASLLKQIAESSRKEPGNERYDVVQRIDRDNQFAILEAWSTLKAQQAHDAAALMQRFRDNLNPLRSAPYDERPSVGITVAPTSGPIAKGSIYAITHVDVTPNVKDECIVMLTRLAADTRKENGAERFEAWQQNNRPNHFTVTEIWKDQAAEAGHVTSVSTLQFREKLGPMQGALYDERLYRIVE
jgi:quinol monooxygenase YgiN